MIAVIATMKIKLEQAAAFEAAMAELVAATRANEPGVMVYQFCRSQKDPSTYVVMELYQDRATLDAHMQSDWFRSAGPKLQPCLAERPVLEKYDAIG